jgi:hypothetical protein
VQVAAAGHAGGSGAAEDLAFGDLIAEFDVDAAQMRIKALQNKGSFAVYRSLLLMVPNAYRDFTHFT